MWDPSLSARHFTDCAQRTIGHARDRAMDRGMLAGELTETTAGMLAILSMLRWERKLSRVALERLCVDSDDLARDVDEAIDAIGADIRDALGPSQTIDAADDGAATNPRGTIRQAERYP